MEPDFNKILTNLRDFIQVYAKSASNYVNLRQLYNILRKIMYGLREITYDLRHFTYGLRDAARPSPLDAQGRDDRKVHHGTLCQKLCEEFKRRVAPT